MAKRRGNNEGSIYKRPDGKWRAQVSLNGKRLSYTGNSQKECHEWIRKTRTKIEHGLSFEGDKIKLSEFLDQWLTAISGSRSRNTIRQYRWYVEKKILPHLGDVKLKDLTPDRIQNFYHYLLKEKNLSNHAVHYTHTVLRSALYQAVKLGLIIRNPCTATTPPKPNRSEMQIYDEDQVQVLLNTSLEMEDRFYPLYYLAIHTGMRLGELLGLKWKDLNFEKRSLVVQRQVLFPKGGGYVFSPPKSSSGTRTIILGYQAIQVLQQNFAFVRNLAEAAGEAWQDLDLVFPSNQGTPVTHSNLRREYYKVVSKSGLPKIRFHDLRHTAASLMLNNGIPVLIASRRLGHAKASITMDTYGHMIPSKQEEVAILMDELMSPLDVTNCTIFAPDPKKSS